MTIECMNLVICLPTYVAKEGDNIFAIIVKKNHLFIFNYIK